MRFALILFVVGVAVAAYGLLRHSRYDLRPVYQPVGLDAGKSYSASFVPKYARYEVGISTKLGELELANWCTTTRDTECVAGLQLFFADKCSDGSLILEVTTRVKSDGKAVPAQCLAGPYGEPPYWERVWAIELEAGQEYQVETVVSGDPQLQQFEPTLIVRADRRDHKEKAVALVYNVFAAGLVWAIGLAVLVGGLIKRKLRQKA